MDNYKLARRFLTLVWGAQQHEQGYAFLSLKTPTGEWRDFVNDLATQHTDSEVVRRQLDARRGDLYFAPCVFEQPARSNDKARPSRWLYADLDEVDPRSLDLRPTIAIESSPGRYQALWLLKKPLPPKRFARLNQRLTYATGADKGGWHMSKVLRVPGTLNHKYPGKPRVRLMWFDKQAYALATVMEFVRTAADLPYGLSNGDGIVPTLPNTTAAHLRRKYKRKLGRRARKLLTVRTVTPSEDRSARIWELENLCLDAGMSPEETLIVVRSCAYNKWRGQRRETRMLWTEISKAVEARRRSGAQTGGERHRGTPVHEPVAADDPGTHELSAEPDDEDTDDADDAPLDLAPIRLARYLGRDVKPPSWLVENIWGRAAHGVWAGDYKTYKSTLLMDLAVSVASGRPFLGNFAVRRTGPVLYIQEENSHGFMHDRLHRIVQSKGLGNILHANGKRRTPRIEFGHDLDFELLNLSGFNLTKRSHLDALARWCERERPALVILDPFYKLAPGVDENSAAEMVPILAPLSDISNNYDAAVVLAHHYNKPQAGSSATRSGHRISGTGAWSRWWESSIYAERHGEADAYAIKFHGEHREHGNAEQHTAVVDMGADPDTFAVHIADVAAGDDTQDTERDSGLNLDERTERIPVQAVRSTLGLVNSRQAQQLLRRKGYEVRKGRGTNKLYGYPPKR